MHFLSEAVACCVRQTKNITCGCIIAVTTIWTMTATKKREDGESIPSSSTWRMMPTTTAIITCG